MKKAVKFILFLAIFSVVALLVWFVCVKNATKLGFKGYSSKTYDLALEKDRETLLNEDRQCGYVNLHKFIELAARNDKTVFDSTEHVKRTQDSVTISTTSPYIFGIEEGVWWKMSYKGKLPISFPDAQSFTAAVHKENGIEYMYIPYQILYRFAASFKEPLTATSGSLYTSDKSITLKGAGDLTSMPQGVPKIQTGGTVTQHVFSDILQELEIEDANAEDRLRYLWQYARNHWDYVQAPYLGVDSWKSAIRTIDEFYFTNDRTYSGDCDDFAILMASFARELGLSSRIVATFNEKGGHLYAQFKQKIAIKWRSIDYFYGFGTDVPRGIREIILEEL